MNIKLGNIHPMLSFTYEIYYIYVILSPLDKEFTPRFHI